MLPRNSINSQLAGNVAMRNTTMNVSITRIMRVILPLHRLTNADGHRSTTTTCRWCRTWAPATPGMTARDDWNDDVCLRLPAIGVLLDHPDRVPVDRLDHRPDPHLRRHLP